MLRCMQQSRRRTCHDLYMYYGIESDGVYQVELDDEGWSFAVECKFVNTSSGVVARSIFHHDSEVQLYVKPPEEGADTFSRHITYEAGMNSIASVVRASKNCSQFISWRCGGLGFNFDRAKPTAWWISRSGDVQYEWGAVTSAVVGSNGTCACRASW